MDDFEDRSEDLTFGELALPLALDLPPVNPPETVRRALMDRIGLESFRYVFAREGAWVPHPVPGVRVKLLSRDPARGYAMLLLEAPPHTEVPGHDHSGAEECFVLTGDLTIAGRTLGPGDFHHAAAHSTHGPIRTEGGCLVLLVADERDALG